MIYVAAFEECSNCSIRRYNFAIEVANNLVDEGLVEDVIVWYDWYQDFTRLEFKIGMREYYVQIYKVFGLHTYDDDQIARTFQQEHHLRDYIMKLRRELTYEKT